MDQFQTSEGKFLFIVYNMYKSNRIGIQQKNDLKDMLIAKDARIQQVICEVEKESNVGRIERLLEGIMSEEHSPRDLDDTLSHTYKQKRPQLFKFNKSNFTKYVDLKMKASDTLDTYSSNKNLEFRKRLYSTAADSC